MRPYLIFSHDYRRTSAGVRALHLLCHHLNERGYEAWVTSPVVNPEWNTPSAHGDPDTKDRLCEDGIVVYPEVEAGNPLHARRVARYILNRPGFVRGKTEFDPAEELFCYCGLLREFVSSDERILTVPVVDTDVFWNYPPVDRCGGMVWYGKEFDGRSIQGTDSLCEITLDWPATAGELADLFRRSEIFVSYTAYTALVIEARLCDCPVLVVSDMYTFSDLKTGLPGGVDGLTVWGDAGFIDWRVALGLMRARETVADFNGAYMRHIAGFGHQLNCFIRITQAMEE